MYSAVDGSRESVVTRVILSRQRTMCMDRSATKKEQEPTYPSKGFYGNFSFTRSGVVEET